MRRSTRLMMGMAMLAIWGCENTSASGAVPVLDATSAEDTPSGGDGADTAAPSDTAAPADTGEPGDVGEPEDTAGPSDVAPVEDVGAPGDVATPGDSADPPDAPTPVDVDDPKDAGPGPKDAGPGPEPGCCLDDSHCAEGECVLSASVCQAPADEGQCWEADDCAPDEVCTGTFLCPCGKICPALAPKPGTCQKIEPGCCGSDDDCAGGQVCAMQVGPGTCQTLKPGQCFDNDDCAVGTCQGASICPCNTPCFIPTTPGECVDVKPTPPGCCEADFQCPLGQVCAKVPGGPPFDDVDTCAPQPKKGQCWDDGDCSVGESCEGEFLCPCGLACLAPDVPGSCVAPETCKALKNPDFGPCAAIVGVIFNGSECVTVSGCGCGDQCDAVYDSVEACEAACGGGGTCDDFQAPGCIESGCKTGWYCDTDVGCEPSSCVCDPATGDVACTDDCGGGTCVPSDSENQCNADEDCLGEDVCHPGPWCYFWCEPGDPSCCIGSVCGPPESDKCAGYEPPGCSQSGCPEGQFCAQGVGCTPSSCSCNPQTGEVVCTADCGGGTCVDDDMKNECLSDKECDPGQTCVPGPMCNFFCMSGDPACCFGNTCQ